VEDYYRDRGLLLDFEITGGIPETLPVLKQALEPFMRVGGEATESESDAEQTA
jgi:adenylate kinase